jgi:hypothetical protein
VGKLRKKIKGKSPVGCHSDSYWKKKKGKEQLLRTHFLSENTYSETYRESLQNSDSYARLVLIPSFL